jgi:hypothetical protein
MSRYRPIKNPGLMRAVSSDLGCRMLAFLDSGRENVASTIVGTSPSTKAILHLVTDDVIILVGRGRESSLESFHGVG